MRVDEADIMSAAHDRQAVEKLEDIDYAIVENSGHITVFPKPRNK